MATTLSDVQYYTCVALSVPNRPGRKVSESSLLAEHTWPATDNMTAWSVSSEMIPTAQEKLQNSSFKHRRNNHL